MFAFFTEVRPRDKMIVGIMGVVEVDVVAKQLAANWMVGDPVMHKRLPKRHDQMRSDSSNEKKRKLQNKRRRRLKHECFLQL